MTSTLEAPRTVSSTVKLPSVSHVYCSHCWRDERVPQVAVCGHVRQRTGPARKTANPICVVCEHLIKGVYCCTRCGHGPMVLP